jgi:hypothetical protein
MAQSETILSNQSHPGDSTIESYTGEKYKGDGYYGREDGLHTVQYNITGFIGKIKMQATLAIDPTSDDWFTLDSTEHDDSASATGSHIKNFTGNYVWVRAVVSNWTDGTVTSIQLNH